MSEFHLSSFTPFPSELKEKFEMKVVVDSTGDMGPLMAVAGCELKGHSIEVMMPQKYLGRSDLKSAINRAHAWLMENFLSQMRKVA